MPFIVTEMMKSLQGAGTLHWMRKEND